MIRNCLRLGILCAALSGCARGENQSPDALLGTWEAESGEALGKVVTGSKEWGMRLTLSKDKAVWQFDTHEGKKTYEGHFRFDPTKTPRQIELGPPDQNPPKTIAYGIFKVYGNRLQIHMGAERPRDFSEPAMTKLILKKLTH